MQNYVDGTPGETDLDKDQVVAYEYLSTGQLKLIKNFNAKGSGNGVERQNTTNLNESLVDRSWVTNVIYLDSSDTTFSGTDQEKYYYDPLGRTTQFVDQRGVDQCYDFDSVIVGQVDSILSHKANRLDTHRSTSGTVSPARPSFRKCAKNRLPVGRISLGGIGRVKNLVTARHYRTIPGKAAGVAELGRPWNVLKLWRRAIGFSAESLSTSPQCTNESASAYRWLRPVSARCS